MASCRQRASMCNYFDCLTNVYRCFVLGSCPSQSAADVAGVIFSGVCGLLSSKDRESVPAEFSVELTCISLTLVEKMTSSLIAESQPPEVRLYCIEILRVLFQDMEFMAQLVHHFRTGDQIISHLAAKSVSVNVCYHLCKVGPVSPVWQQKCVQAFHSSPPGTELDACLWSLTDVLKRLLKGGHQEILGKLLAAFDASISALCSKFLLERKKASDLVDFTSHRHWTTTFCLLLNLLEVLTASSLACGAGVCLKSQRLTHLHSSALLTSISCTSDYFVKKRVLLLLKRAVLQSSGEDWALGGGLSSGVKYEYFTSDLNILAQSVLAAVNANWLQSIQVESASFFGGTRHVRGDEGQKPDCVILRAVSLLLLKSVELHIQTAEGTGVDSASEVYGCLQSLWGFLKRCSVWVSEITHLCCWLSLVFGEQDDDMMEAAKALLSIFFHQRLSSGLDDFHLLEAACASGCNPHCHFLLLLQSVSFDHSILLDFLISTETCFLEYFVRYLKYLRVDWQGFIVTCKRIGTSDSHLSLPEPLTCSCHSDVPAPTYKSQPLVEKMSLAAGPRLVEYDSSDESDRENMDISEDEPGASMCEQGRFDALDLKEDTSGPWISVSPKQHEASESTGLLSEPGTVVRGQPQGPLLKVLPSTQRSCANMASVSGRATCETSSRAVLCLSELREVVTRLQRKKLFPYNPSSLLKLLAQVEKCSHQQQLS
ncbi:Protein Lines -like protein 1 [Channa argus]|uniref:Protein Lines-like protein 1 n=1 Tax=Channa argus TaxID=215402 RepID=A0A6G1P9T8_CHAAH|nr:Protein Lines -like protein 1 [Channa argus]